MQFMRQSFRQEVKMDYLVNNAGIPLKTKHFIGALLFNPEFQLLLSYRIQNRLVEKGWLGRLITKFLWIWNVYLFGCHIKPKAKIAGGVRIEHANGIMISQNSIIESGVTLYQQITIGAKTTSAFEAPYIQKNAVIYAGAKVIGGIVIGEGAKVGANSVVLESVPKGAIAVGIPAVIKNVKTKD